jgi:chromosome partitioning protein
MEAYTIAVCHQKGGVAKTTTIAALATIFAQQGRPTLAVDLDPTANLTAALGLSPARLSRSVADILLGNERLSNVRQPTSVAGLDILPSNADMVTVARFLHLRPQYELLLQRGLAQNNLPTYDFILLDCPPSASGLVVTALSAAHLVIVPTQCEYFSLQALDSTFKVIQSVRAKVNPTLRLRLLVTMFDRRGALHAQALAQVRQRYGHLLFETTIGFDSKLRESQVAGVAVPLYAPASRATGQYLALARELSAYVEKKSIPQAA